MKYLVFDSAANSIARRFPMACFINVEISLVVAKVQKGLILLRMHSTAVTKIVNKFDLGQILPDVKHDYSLQLMNKTGVLL